MTTYDEATKHDNASCPCKHLPLLLSSFTAAEHGSVSSLLSKANIGALATLKDSAGNTPLHLAAQHGHVSVVAMLLDASASSRPNDTAVNASDGGATPLHRASFSGAVSTMQLLMADPGCDFLAQDTSFGDLQTPLHKACSGGRYLAVQLLLQALQTRNLLDAGLTAKDCAGRKPIDIVLEKLPNQEQEQLNVRRWDCVADGVANWHTCQQILEKCWNIRQAATDLPEDESSSLPLFDFPHGSTLPPKIQNGGEVCIGCVQNGECQTSAWEKSFRAALRLSIEPNNFRYREHDKDNCGMALSEARAVTRIIRPDDELTTVSTGEKASAAPTAFGKQCSVCRNICSVLYQHNDTTVCKGCRKRLRKSNV